MHPFSALLTFALLAAHVCASPTERLTSRKAKIIRDALKPRYFAAAIGAPHLQNASDPVFAQTAVAEFGGCTPENEMKWESIEPEHNVFNYTSGEVVAHFAKKNNYVLRGHTLVWHSQLAPWVTNFTGTALTHVMRNHITNVMDHFKGRIYAWDVVNESLNDDGTFRETPFYNITNSSSYIYDAFTTARSVGDKAKLYINDYNTEGINNKSDALYALVKDLKKKNLIDGVGFQSHFIVGEVPTDLKANLERFTALGVEVALTEVDIRANTPVNASTIAQAKKDWAFTVDACVSVKKCVGVTTWGITDEYSWIPATFPGQGYGLLWDDNYNKKPAYFSVLDSLT